MWGAKGKTRFYFLQKQLSSKIISIYCKKKRIKLVRLVEFSSAIFNDNWCNYQCWVVVMCTGSVTTVASQRCLVSGMELRLLIHSDWQFFTKLVYTKIFFYNTFKWTIRLHREAEAAGSNYAASVKSGLVLRRFIETHWDSGRERRRRTRLNSSRGNTGSSYSSPPMVTDRSSLQHNNNNSLFLWTKQCRRPLFKTVGKTDSIGIPALSSPVENVNSNLFLVCQVARGSFAANIQKLSRLSSCLPRETAQ